MVSDSPASQSGASQPAGKTPKPAGIQAFGHWFRTGTGIASTMVSLTVGILSLLFLVRPALQPGNEVASLGAIISNPAVETGVSLGKYSDRTGQPLAAEVDREIAGLVVSFDLAIFGFEGETTSLKWSVLDGTTLNPVDEEWLVDQPGWPNGLFTPEATEDRVNSEIWVPEPQGSGPFLVRLQLFDQDGIRLASVDTAPFETPE